MQVSQVIRHVRRPRIRSIAVCVLRPAALLRLVLFLRFGVVPSIFTELTAELDLDSQLCKSLLKGLEQRLVLVAALLQSIQEAQVRAVRTAGEIIPREHCSVGREQCVEWLARKGRRSGRFAEDVVEDLNVCMDRLETGAMHNIGRPAAYRHR